MRALPAILLAALGGAEAYAAWQRNANRTSLYKQAEARAKALGRPLLVIGDPNAGAYTSLFQAYDCGDECLDLHGCPACPVSYEADVTKPLTSIADDSRVVFVSCVLEYTSDFEAAWRQIVRIAGSPDNVFLARVQPWTLTAALYPGAHYTLWPVSFNDERPTYGAIEVSSTRKVASLAVIGGLLLWTFWPR